MSSLSPDIFLYPFYAFYSSVFRFFLVSSTFFRIKELHLRTREIVQWIEYFFFFFACGQHRLEPHILIPGSSKETKQTSSRLVPKPSRSNFWIIHRLGESPKHLECGPKTKTIPSQTKAKKKKSVIFIGLSQFFFLNSHSTWMNMPGSCILFSDSFHLSQSPQNLSSLSPKANFYHFRWLSNILVQWIVYATTCTSSHALMGN